MEHFLFPLGNAASVSECIEKVKNGSTQSPFSPKTVTNVNICCTGQEGETSNCSTAGICQPSNRKSWTTTGKDLKIL